MAIEIYAKTKCFEGYIKLPTMKKKRPICGWKGAIEGIHCTKEIAGIRTVYDGGVKILISPAAYCTAHVESAESPIKWGGANCSLDSSHFEFIPFKQPDSIPMLFHKSNT